MPERPGPSIGGLTRARVDPLSAVTTGADGRVFSSGARLTRFGAVAVAAVQAQDADGSVAWTHDRGEDGLSWLRDAFMLPDGDVIFAGWHHTWLRARRSCTAAMPDGRGYAGL